MNNLFEDASQTLPAVQILPNAPAFDFADTEGKLVFSAVANPQPPNFVS